MKTFYWVSGALLLLNIVMITIFQGPILRCYTDDAELLKIANDVYYFLIIFHFPDGFKGMLYGIIKALDRAGCAAVINFSGHWCINLTLQLTLTFYFKMGLPGIWIGKTVLEYYIMSTYLMLCNCTDWEAVAIEASK
jgi:Na+-driven multidrug efflux pump